MTFRIATELTDQIVARAAASPEVEVCGLLLGSGETVEEARPCRNVAADPACRFEIDPAALIAALRAARAGGAAVLGCYHSHPSGSAEPSARDAADAAPNGWLWIIATQTEARGWQAIEGGEVYGRFRAGSLTVCASEIETSVSTSDLFFQSCPPMGEPNSWNAKRSCPPRT